MTSERDRLRRIAEEYHTETDFDRYLIGYSFRVLAPDLKGPRILEMGAGDGLMTDLLLPHAEHLTVVDASTRFTENLAKRLDPRRVTCQMCLFEDFAPVERFDTIVAARVLEHVEDPVGLLTRMTSWLAPGGGVCIVVPNAGSLHRRVGVAMGLLRRLDDMSDRDIQYGHRRVYDWELLRRHLREAGLAIRREAGSFLKCLSNAQMERFDPKLLDAFFVVGTELPEWCAELYTFCGAVEDG